MALALAGLAFGPAGVLVWLLLSGLAQLQLLLCDYVQHYGLLRRRTPSGRWEPVGPAHSWDAPPGLSTLAMRTGPLHSDHPRGREGRGGRRGTTEPAQIAGWPEGRRGSGRPTLPHSLPAMYALALVPPLWHRVMDPRVLALRRRQTAAPAAM